MFQERTIRRVSKLLLLLILTMTVSSGSADSPEEVSLREEHAAGYYNECGEGVGGACAGGLQCVTFGSNETGVCLPGCATDSDCPLKPGRSLCDVSLGDGTSVCALDCTFARCPSGTVCQQEGERNICADW